MWVARPREKSAAENDLMTIRLTYRIAGWMMPGLLLATSAMAATPSAPTILIPPTNHVLAAGGTLTLSVTSASVGAQNFQWFKNGDMVSDATNSTLTRTAAVSDSGIYYVAITNAFGMSISTPVMVTVGTPQLFAWGWNSYGQLGDGTTTNRLMPVAVVSDVVLAVAGEVHSLFVKGDSTLWAMGYNGDGELGDGTMTTRHLPVYVASNVVSVAAGSWHSLYLKHDGTLWAMGQNLHGQLGDGTTTARHSPISVASNVVALSAGLDFSTYLTGDGTLWAMGKNNYGQLGDGTTVEKHSPISVASNVVAMTTGYSHTLFLNGDGTLWAMGENSSGQLGDGTTVEKHSPVAITNPVTALAAGRTHSLYLKGDGSLWATGSNNYGQLGDGTMTARHSPVSVADNVTALAAGAYHSLYLKGDGSLWATGMNLNGQLGDGTTTKRTTPVSVPGLTLSGIVSGNGANHTLAVGEPLPLTISEQPLSQTVALGSNVTFSVTASGFAPLSYQWYFNDDAISGATAANCSLPGVTGSNAGNYMVVVSNPECSVTSGVAVLTVNRIVTSVTVSSSTNTIAYGDLVSFTAHVSPETASGTVTFKDGAATLGTCALTNGIAIYATRDLSAGGYSLTAEYGGDDDHAVSDSTPLSQTVNASLLTVTALSQTRTYGEANSNLTFTLSGFVNGEDASVVTGSPTLTTAAEVGSDVGEYAINVTLGTLSAINYDFALVPGVLTVTQALASVTLSGLSQTYDGTPKPVTVTTVPEGLTVALTYEGSTTAPTAAGSYAVICTVNEVNWQGSASGTLTLAKIDQTITFAAIPPQPVAGAVGLVATASSGLPVSFRVLNGPGSIADGTNLTFSAPGTVGVVASQAGNDIYVAALDVTNHVPVYAVTPDNGPLAGSNTVTLSIGTLGTVTNVFVGGLPTTIEGVDANGLTLTMPAASSAGIKDIVLQTSDNGDFTLTGAYTVNPAGWIGRRQLVSSGWSALGSGVLGSSVSALAVNGSDLYAGGTFTTAGGVPASRVAKWNGTYWTGLGSGLAGSAVYALAHDGENLYAGGDFTNAGGVVASYVAMWNGTVWTNLASGMNGTVHALALDGENNLYAGGNFTNAGGVVASNVAMWNGRSWTNLTSGVDGWVRALAHDGTSLYVGGYFTTAGGMTANRVAQWNGSEWSGLGSGMNNNVRALTLVGSNLVAGGDFIAAGTETAHAVALWNGSSWTALGSGMNDSVAALASDGVNLIAGGYFTTAGGVEASSVALWDGTGWTDLGGSMDGTVKALAYDAANNLVAGGVFVTIDGLVVNRIAVCGETQVELSGVEPASGVLAGGYTVTISGENLCNGSDVTNVTLCGVAVTDIQSQSATQIVVTAGMATIMGLGDVRVYSDSYGETVKADAFTYLADQTINFAAIAPQPRTATVGLAATASSDLPVSFRVLSGPGTIADGTNLTFSAAGLVVIAASQEGDAIFGAATDVILWVYVYTVTPDNGPFSGGNSVTINSGYTGVVTNVQVDGVSAEIQGFGLEGLTLTMPSTGSAGAKDILVQTSEDGDFRLAGAYTVNPAGQIGGITPGPNVWAGLGDGLSGSAVYALALGETNLYAGGTFAIAGGETVNDAQWDGIRWSDLGDGMNDTVTALAYDGVNLYAGGYFTTAGGVAANYVALWDGTDWKSLGIGLNGPVSAMVCDGTDLYVGGTFTTAGTVAASRVAKWNGTEWTSLGSGMLGSSVMALAHDGMNLYAGGSFSKVGDVAANSVAMWNGTSWSGLGSGMNGTVYALDCVGTNLVAGGAFTTAGGVEANAVAQWNGTAWSSLGSGMNDTVRALAHHGTTVYAGGYFTTAGGVAANQVAKWNGTGWSALDDGVNRWVRALAHDGTNLYVGGYFTVAGGVAANQVAVWKPTIIVHESVMPESGALSGGYPVVIGGANLCNGSDVTQVTICGVSASIVSQSATQIVVMAGAAVTASLGDVRVYSVSYGETVKSDAFNYREADPIWDPQMQDDEFFGVQSNRFGFNIIGSSNLSVVIEACTNLVNPVWVPVETNILTEGRFYFSDPAWTNYPARFYRLRQP